MDKQDLTNDSFASDLNQFQQKNAYDSFLSERQEQVRQTPELGVKGHKPKQTADFGVSEIQPQPPKINQVTYLNESKT